MYNGDTWLFALFLAAMAYLLFRRGSAYRFHAVLAIAAACLILFNQAAYLLFERVMGGAETYYRFLWMIPVVPILAYAAVDLVAMRKKRCGKLLAAGAVLLAVVFAGTPYPDAQSVQKPSEIRYLNTDAVEVCRLINEDRKSAYPELQDVKVASPIELMMSLRLEEPGFRNAIGREIYLNDENRQLNTLPYRRQRQLLRMVNGKKLRVKSIKKLLKTANVQYVVITSKKNREARMQKAGCTIVARMERYTIYRAPE